MPWREELGARMTKEICDLLRALSAQESKALEEIRVYLDRPLELTIGGKRQRMQFSADRAQMDELLAALSGYALYSCEAQLAQGYLPLPGGHRAGVCGRMTREESGRRRMCRVTSICIRIARHIPGASLPIRPLLLSADGRARRVLLLGAPGCGKTTVLRDAALYLSDEAGLHVAAADEREELFPSIPPGRGQRLDVMGGCEKAYAIPALLRTMAPQVIVTDEIGCTEDEVAVRDAARCGAGLLVSAHADSFIALKQRPMLCRLVEAGTFDCCIHLGRYGKVIEVWDTDANHI